MKRIVFILLAVLSWRCASIAPPGGGPEDKTQPMVLANIPANDSVRVGRSPLIVMEFSETMNHESVEKAVFISPPQSTAPEFSWHKNVLTIQLADSLPENRTCVVTIGTEARDAHNNALFKAYSFAFSTGDSIDAGKIIGKVVTEVKTAVSVLAYRLDGTADPDSQIYKRKADYVTQTEQTGRFELPYLAAGTYRVLALIDADEDGRYTQGTDAVGLSYKDGILRDSQMTVSRLDIRTFTEDTARFDVIDAMPLNPNTVGVAFNRTLFVPRYTEGHSLVADPRTQFEITDSNSGAPVTIRDMYLNTKNLSDFRMRVEKLDTSHTYFLHARNVLSERSDTLYESRVRLEAVQGLDTGRVSPEWVLPEGTTPDNLLPADPLVFRFDKGLDRSSLERNLSVTDSSGNAVAGKFQWWNSSYSTFFPNRTYASLMSYTIRLKGDSILDWEGLPMSDTILELAFRSFKTDSLGSVTGRIEDDRPSATGTFVVTCRSLQSQTRGYSQEISAPGAFEFRFVVPGKYVLAAFRDEDGNGVYSHGRTAPIVFAERFTAYADTVIVRPNWETSNVILLFAK